MKLVVFGFVLLGLAGCTLDTRSQVKEDDEKTRIRKQMANIQASTADVNTRFQDVEDDVKKANGRIEALETRMQRSASENAGKSAQEIAGVSGKLADNDKAYREEFAELHKEIDALKAQLGARESAAAAASVADPFAAAESKYDKKEFKESILDYQAYRKKNPSGKLFAMATYKIGAAFQEMGMVDEARAFYDEVISKSPKSKEAASAKAKLKALSKKK